MPDPQRPPNDVTPDNPASPDQGASALPTADAATTLDITTAAVSPARLPSPRTIGPYRLIEEIGEGGMGQVWLAEQTAPLQRRVAVKLIRAGMYDDSMLRRFQSERQSLAIMDHPCIAKVFDAGATSDGQPYFVMEYVPGQPITRYCDEKKLKIHDRLELFIQACEGVQHAHQKAIIHRDLKPANVLVLEVDGKPTPRIIDFGLAKALGPASDAFVTRIGGFVGTPGFMSPEQADPSILDVDTRTDVYSLGMILYVLLTGTLPFDSERWRTKPFDEVLRELREEDAPSPSARLTSQRAAATVAAENRGTHPRQLVKLLHGDLDWITVKAIEKDRARRYGTPSELAADIRRYLANEPVVARPASTGYRLAKYARRHRIGVSVAAALVMLLAGFAIVQAAELRRITRERDRANRITDFMTNMFRQTDPSVARGNTVTAREILDKASQAIDTGLAKDPELQAQMMNIMSIVYDNLGLPAKSEALSARTVDIRRVVLGPKNPDTIEAESGLGWELFRSGKYSDAEKLLREVLRQSRAVLGPDHRTTLETMRVLSAVLNEEGRDPEAESLARETLQIHLRVFGPDKPETINAMDNLAAVLRRERHLPEAEKLYRESLDVHLRQLGPEHPITLLSMTNLGDVLSEEDQLPEAEKLYRQALQIDLRILGPDHPYTADVMNDLANVLSDEHQYAESEKLNQEALEIRRRIYGPDHPITAGSVYNLACLAALKGKPDQALSLLRQAMDHGLSPALELNMESDSDLQSLHNNPRFTALVAQAKERATSANRKAP